MFFSVLKNNLSLETASNTKLLFFESTDSVKTIQEFSNSFQNIDFFYIDNNPFNMPLYQFYWISSLFWLIIIKNWKIVKKIESWITNPELYSLLVSLS